MEINISKEINNRLFVLSAVILSAFAVNLLLGRGFDLTSMSIGINYENCDTDNIYDFLFIVIKRVKQFIIIFLLLKCINPEMIIKMLCLIAGIGFGTIITIQIYYYGVEGIILFLICILPHYPVYIFLIKNIYDFNNCCKNEKLILRFLLLFTMLLAIGLVLEGFFSKFFLRLYYQYIVMR